MCVIHAAFAQWNAFNADMLSGSMQWLDNTEREYGSRFRDPISRSEWLCGRILLRWLLSRILSGDPGRWRFAYEPHGRLIIKQDIDCGHSVSLSRAPGIAVAAVASGLPVGVDVEAVSASGVTKDLLTDTERVMAAGDPVALTGFWCMREAVAKGCGAGAAWAMEQRCFRDANSYDDPSGNTWSSVQLRVPAGWTGAIAVPGIFPEVILIDALTAGFPEYQSADRYNYMSQIFFHSEIC